MEAKIVYQNGNPFYSINGVLYPPVAFRSFRPTPANLSLFKRAGVNFFQMQVAGENCAMQIPYSLFGPVWIDKKAYNFSAFDKQIEMFKKFAPNSFYCIFIQLDTPKKWLINHPNSVSSFEHLEVAVLDEEWRKDAAEYLKDLISYCEDKYGDIIYSYAFSAGSSTEWFSHPSNNIYETITNDYKLYCNDFTAVVPTRDELLANHEDSFREPNSNEVRYINYCAENTTNLLCYFASEAQKVLYHKKILGVFYGYIALPHNLHFTHAYEKVWKSDDIDMIYSPAAYAPFRDIDGVSGHQLAVDSLSLHGKLYLHELDHRTHLACYPLEHPITHKERGYTDDSGIILGCYETEFESIMVLRRELCVALLKGSALWWFDFFGGYYATPTMEKEIEKQCKAFERVSNHYIIRESVAEIAVLVDPNTLPLLHDGANIHFDFIRWNLNSLNKTGAPYDLFNLNDLTLLEKCKYKLYIFLNAFEIPKSISDYVKEKLNDKMKAWVYAPNYVSSEKLDSDEINDIIGMELKPFETNIAEKIKIAGVEFGFSYPISPMFEIIDRESTILGKYVSNGKNAIGIKANNIYIGAGNIHEDIWRMLAQCADVHIYTEQGGALYINTQFISYQTTISETCKIMLNSDYELEDLFDGRILKTKNKTLEYNTEKGTTKLFLIKNKIN